MEVSVANVTMAYDAATKVSHSVLSLEDDLLEIL